MEPLSQTSNPYTVGYDQDKLSDGNAPVYQPTYQAGAFNPYHAGYDQPIEPDIQICPVQQHAIQMQPLGTARNSQQQRKVEDDWCCFGEGVGHTYLAICVCYFCCGWCTGIPAISYAMSAQDMYALGRLEEAKANQKKARFWTIVTLIVGLAVMSAIGYAISHALNEYNIV